MNKMIKLTAITFFGASLMVGGLNAAAAPAAGIEAEVAARLAAADARAAVVDREADIVDAVNAVKCGRCKAHCGRQARKIVTIGDDLVKGAVFDVVTGTLATGVVTAGLYNNNVNGMAACFDNSFAIRFTDGLPVGCPSDVRYCVTEMVTDFPSYARVSAGALLNDSLACDVQPRVQLGHVWCTIAAATGIHIAWRALKAAAATCNAVVGCCSCRQARQAHPHAE